MAITREATTSATGDQIWGNLIEDPKRWGDWLTPISSFEERPSGPVRAGSEFSVRLGKMGGKIRVKEAVHGKRLRWQAGPSMMLAMGMGMTGTLEFAPANGSTHVLLRMKTPMGPMGKMMMRMMAGLKPDDEMTETIARIKSLSER